MILAVPPDRWEAFRALCAGEDVEATVLGRFEPTGRLRLRYEGQQVADLSMDFLHEGRPPVVRRATWRPPDGAAGAVARVPLAERPRPENFTDTLLRIPRLKKNPPVPPSAETAFPPPA